MIKKPWPLAVPAKLDAQNGTDYLPSQLCLSRNKSQDAASDLRVRTARFEREVVMGAVERFGRTRAAAKHLKISQAGRAGG